MSSSSSPIVVSYPIHETTLANGLRVVVSPDHSAPAVAVNLWYDVGSRDESEHQSGLAHLFEHLMFEGSDHVGKGEHLALMQSVGGHVNATTWFDRTNYFETLPVGALDLALWLEADRLATVGRHLNQENLDNQRDVVKAERRQRYDNAPYGDVLEHIVTLAFPPDHPYGHTTIGSMADLDAVSVDDARSFFRTHYAPDNAVLTLVGDITPEDGLARIERYFGGLPAGGRTARPPVVPLPPLRSSGARSAEGDVPADASYLVWRLPPHGSAPLDALEYAFHTLGGGQNSRLHRTLVREAGLASSVGATAFELIGGNSIGIAYALGLPDTPAEALADALLAQVAELTVTEREYDRAAATLESQWLSELSPIDARADRLGEFATLHGDPHRINTRLRTLQSVTPGTVASATGEWLAPDSAAILHYRRSRA